VAGIAAGQQTGDRRSASTSDGFVGVCAAWDDDRQAVLTRGRDQALVVGHEVGQLVTEQERGGQVDGVEWS
jgi:hypothetical protein